MMTLWCLFGSPLMIGAELTLLDKDTLALLTNREVLALLNPALRPRQLMRDGEQAIWIAADGKAIYAALFNLSDGERTVGIPLEKLPLDAPGRAKELWSGEERALSGKLETKLPEHGCALYRLG